jgi:hypothetical protein
LKVINEKGNDSNEMSLVDDDYERSFDSMRNFLRERKSQDFMNKLFGSYVKRNPIWMKNRKPYVN